MSEPAAWVQCPGCDDIWCTVHQMHASDCDCPAIEDWPDGVDPYAEGGQPLTPSDDLT